jgi:transposase
MLQEYGWSLSGQKAIRRTQIYPYKKFNLIFAMKYNKVIGYELSKELYDTNKLIHFINKTLNKYTNNLLIFDNVVFHKSKKVLSILEKHNIQYLYIVLYHPENNPIEKLFSQLKSYLKIANCQSYDEIYKIINDFMDNYFICQNCKSLLINQVNVVCQNCGYYKKNENFN